MPRRSRARRKRAVEEALLLLLLLLLLNEAPKLKLASSEAQTRVRPYAGRRAEYLRFCCYRQLQLGNAQTQGMRKQTTHSLGHVYLQLQLADAVPEGRRLPSCRVYF